MLLASVALTAATISPASAQDPSPTDTTVVVPDSLAHLTTAERQARAQSYISSARSAEHEDNHGEAIRFYRAAMDVDFFVTPDVAKELANQYTWSGDSKSAVVWYTVALAYHPDDTDAMMGKARALSWGDQLDQSLRVYSEVPDGSDDAEVGASVARVTSWKDDLSEAEALYRQVLETHPDNLEAQLGLAQVVNWSGRHREAADLYDGVLADHPDNRDAQEGLANAYYWLGRYDLAGNVVSDREGLDEVATNVDRAKAFNALLTYYINEDSDDIRREFTTVGFGLNAASMTRLSAQFVQGHIVEDGLPSVRRESIRLAWGQRFNNALALSLAPGYQWNSYDAAALPPNPDFEDEFNLFTLESYLTYTPKDWVRADLGTNRYTIPNPLTLYRNISVVPVNLGLDWRFSPRLMLVSALSYSDYSDGNSRWLGFQRLDYKLPWRFPIEVPHTLVSRTSWGYFAFAKTLDNGYYNPEQYLNLYEELGTSFKLGKRGNLDINLRVGGDIENMETWIVAAAADVFLNLQLTRGLYLKSGYFGSRSRLETASGYLQNSFYITAEYLFY